MKKLVIVGSGIAGLAHAVAAQENGWHVTVLERTGRPLGASVRNFGTLWPIGQPAGPLQDLAFRSLERWQSLSNAAGFWFARTGSVHLAYFEEGWRVLNEYADQQADDNLRLLDPGEIQQRLSHVCTDNLLGGLFSPHEAVVEPAEAINGIVDWLSEGGVDFYFHATVTEVQNHHIRTGDGRLFEFDRLMICSGDVVGLLYPNLLQEIGARRCKLQMMRTVPQPAAWQIAPTLVADLTLRHYASFAQCPSLDALRDRVQTEMPDYDKWGIHVIAAQKPDGSLVLGDTHEYATDFTPGSRTDMDAAVLDYLIRFLDVPDLTIARRWSGTYLIAPGDDSHILLAPADNVQIFTGLGGAGMTLSFALAEKNVASW